MHNFSNCYSSNVAIYKLKREMLSCTVHLIKPSQSVSNNHFSVLCVHLSMHAYERERETSVSKRTVQVKDLPLSVVTVTSWPGRISLMLVGRSML